MKEKIITQDRQYPLSEVVKSCVLKLVNTPKSPFWWTGTRKDKFQKRFEHEQARPGQRFYDGNNGDLWRVIAADVAHNRLIVQNLDQNWDYPRIVWWD